MKMKKWWIGLLAAVVAAAGSTAALAASQDAPAAEPAAAEASVPETTAPAGNPFCSYCEEGSHCYTDADGDGICDHRQDGTNCRNGCYTGSHYGGYRRHHAEGHHGCR